MAICPNCKAQVNDSEKSCPMCGKAIAGDQLENIPTNTDGWQKFVIAAVIFLLIIVAFTFYGAESREDQAAQDIFGPQAARIIKNVAIQTGLRDSAGLPQYQTRADPRAADVLIVFPAGPLTPRQASTFGEEVCVSLARTYVRKGYMPRHLRVIVASQTQNGLQYYGQALYNGNIDALGWEPVASN